MSTSTEHPVPDLGGDNLVSWWECDGKVAEAAAEAAAMGTVSGHPWRTKLPAPEPPHGLSPPLRIEREGFCPV